MKTEEKEGKILARFEDLRLWPKNPKTVEEKDLFRLKKQIIELGIYKPLLVTPDGEILGGNQRYKAIKELRGLPENAGKFDMVWVSVVEAWTDDERFKYALSDNDTIGKYNRVQLYEIVKGLGGQTPLFDDYKLQFSSDETLETLKGDINLTEEELKQKTLESALRQAGINEQVVEAVSQMSEYNKTINKLKNVDIEGEKVGERFAVYFWCDNQEDLNFINSVYATSRKYNYSTEKLIEITKKFLEPETVIPEPSEIL